MSSKTQDFRQGGGRPSGGYFVNGVRVPSVTTITGHFKGAGLIHWAYNRGLEKKELYESRDQAAGIGAVVHQWIEDDLYGRDHAGESLSMEDLEFANTSYTAWQRWSKQVELELVETEVPLLSEEYGYGGTLDAVAYVSGELALFDWKTSGGSYPDYIAQVAAYRNLLWERDGSGPESAYLVRVGKEYGDFHVHSWPEVVLDDGWEFFLALKKSYELEKKLKRVAS
jgi:hypothetical protein